MSSETEAALTQVTNSLEAANLEDVTTRHRRERRELQSKIQALKKNAPKKKRKEAMEEVAKLEKEMDDRHAEELKTVQAKYVPPNVNSNDENAPATAKIAATTKDQPEAFLKDEVNGSSGSAPQRVSKAQKRRDKKAQEARAREANLRQAAEESQNAPKATEMRAIKEKLKERGLALHLVPSDGDCMFNAIRHQLLQTGLGSFSVQELRNETANYINAHKDTLNAFMTHPQTGDLLNDIEFEKYCSAIRSTSAWGGHIELKALSSVLKVPIEVLHATGPSTMIDEFPGAPLLITYHRHMYSLGEHYNSTVSLEDVSAEEDNDEE